MPEYWVKTLDDPRLDPYRQLKQTNLTRWSGRFIAEGEKVVQRLLASPYSVETLLLAERRRDLLTDTIFARQSVLLVPEVLAQELLGFQFHAGVLACGIRNSAPAMARLPEEKSGQTLLVACERLTDPDNLGTLIRLCAAFSIAGLILGPGCADPFSRRTLRVSMGNAFTLPIVETGDLVSQMQHLRQRGFSLLATVLDSTAEALHTVRRPHKGIVLLGNEAHGLDARWQHESDQSVSIPMDSGVDSLNVGVAAGIILHYLTRIAQD